jgi:hypothetical protein
MTSEWRQRRIAKNETSFRDINERLEQDLRKVQGVSELLPFVCECGDRSCEQAVHLTFAEYEQVRADSRRFAVVPGHVYPEAERVLDGNDRYQMIQKIGDAVDIADARDDRARARTNPRRAP